MTALERIAGLVDDAEHDLVLSCFLAAENKATEALQQIIYLNDCRELQDRASIALLQALYETQRFSSSQKALCDYFGSLAASPANSLLLWLSLALDGPCKPQAQSLILQLLQAKRPDSADGWSRRQYLALLHLYIFEILLFEMREVSEVVRWLEATQLPVEQEEKQMLKEELLSLQPSSHLPSPTALRQHNHNHRGCHAPLLSDEPSESQPALTVRTTAAAAAGEGGAGRRLQERQQGGAGAASRQPPGQAAQHPEIEPDASPRGACVEAAAAGAQLGWAGGAYKQLAGAAKAVCGYTAGLGSRAERQAGQSPLPNVQAAAGTMLGAVLLYAVYAERHAIRRRLGAFRRNTLQALSDLLRMGLSLSPNPMTAPR